MAWFGLDSESVLRRVRENNNEAKVPSLSASVLRGSLGFTVVSVLGFAPWAVAGGWFYRQVGEAGMYVACALVFIASAGLALHPLIVGPDSLVRFYKLFTATFSIYSVAWIVAWMGLKGHVGSIVGLLVGTALMGWMFTRAFGARGKTMKVVSALFVLNALGYFVGGIVEGWLLRMEGLPVGRGTQLVAAKSVWGIFYGAGFGAGLGYAFYACQGAIRARLAEEGVRPGGGAGPDEST